MTHQEESRQDNLPMVTRAAPVRTVNAESRTLDVVFSAGAKVRRSRWTGWDARVPYDETIIVSKTAVNMERLAAGGPVLDSHNTYTTRAQVAVVDKAWIEGGEAWARVRFPSAGIDEAADRMFGLVSEGIVRNVSVGYSQDEVRIVEADKKGDVEQWFVERWTPYEISFVTVGADAKAQVRSDEARDGQRSFPAVIRSTSKETRHMADPVNEPVAGSETDTAARVVAQAPAQSSAPVVDTAAAERAVAAERARSAEILAIGTRAGFAQPDIDAAIRAGEAVEAFRARAFDHLAARSASQGATSSVQVVRDETDTRRAGLREALVANLARSRGERVEPSDNARRYAGLTLSEMAAEAIGERHYPRTIRDREDVFQRAFHTTSDFPLIFAGAINARLEASYIAAPPVYRRIAVQRNFNDFRTHDMIRPGDFPMLQAVNQAGEVKLGTFGEKREQVAVAAYGVQFNITRQMLVNDNLGAIDQVLAGQGTTVALFEEQTFFAMKGVASGAGPTLAETGRAVFNATDGNLAGTASAITNAALGLGRASLRKMKRLDGMQMGLAPSILLVTPDKETEAETVLAQIAPAQASNVNIFSGRLNLVVGGQLTGNAWELYTDPSVGANWMWGLLDGYTAPRLRLEEKFGVQGVGVLLEHDFGCGAMDYRFGYRNAGA